ncbi:MAG: hypothetical protein KBC73_19865 [Burkholderiaceae bacterium]|nr:hypothetical protein [Burkholderiaceae bacterium]
MDTPPTPRPTLALDGVDAVVAEPLRFKARLAIGENAYASLRVVNRMRELWDVLGAAGAGAALAKSGLLAGGAATPIGWVALAALASGGACYGLYRLLGHTKGERVIEIPKYLNTPLDTLGLALFDLLAPLALRLAAVDGQVPAAARQRLQAHLVDDWGLSAGFVEQAVALVEADALRGSPEDMALELSQFLHASPDCNHAAIAADTTAFLRQLLESDGALDDGQAAALARVSELLSLPPGSEWTQRWQLVREQARDLGSQAWQGAAVAADRAQQAWAQAQARLPDKAVVEASVGQGVAQAGRLLKQGAGLAAEAADAAGELAQGLAHELSDKAGQASQWLRQQAARRRRTPR